MNKLVLIKSADFNGIALDCYVEPQQEDKGNFLATPKIHNRYKDRLNKFSTVVNLSTVEGGREIEREVTVYSFKGLLEICRYSRKPKADAVMDWLFEIADEIRRTGSYSLKSAPKNEPLPKDVFKTAEEIVNKALACKEDEDFFAVLALDKLFSSMYGKSALEAAGLSICQEIGYIPLDKSSTPPCHKEKQFVLRNYLSCERDERFIMPLDWD